MVRVLLLTMMLLTVAGGVARAGEADDLRRDLKEGSSAVRRTAIRRLVRAEVPSDDALLDALIAAATDPDASVRAEVGRTGLSRFIWNATSQDPRAVALAIRLAADPDRNVVHNAIYFGLSTVKTPGDDVLTALAKAAASAKAYDPVNHHGRIAWGLKNVHVAPERLAAAFEPYWKAADESPKPAYFLYQLYVAATGSAPPDPARFADLKRRVEELDSAHRRAVLATAPNVVPDLTDGDSAKRMSVLRQITDTEDLLSSLEKPQFDALLAAANDADPRVRTDIARLVGNQWVGAKDADPRAMELIVRMARDPDAKVRYAAVYFGLSSAPEKSDEAIRAMIDAGVATQPYDPNLHGRIAWGLKGETPSRLEPIFAPYLAAGRDAGAARIAAMMFTAATGRVPPNAQAVTRDLTFMVQFGAAGKMESAAMLAAFKAAAPAGSFTDVYLFPGPYGAAVVRGADARRSLVDALANSPLRTQADITFYDPRMEANLTGQSTLHERSTSTAATRPAVTYEQAFRDFHAHLGEVYPGFELKGIDWAKVGAELTPRAAAVKSDAEFGLLCLELVARLEDSHAQLVPAKAPIPDVPFPRYDPGLACLLDDHDRPVVYSVEEDGPAAKAGIRPGTLVLTIDAVPAEEAMAATMKQLRVYSGYSSERTLRYDAVRSLLSRLKRGTTVRLETETADGKWQTFDLPCMIDARYLPRLPVPISGINDSADVSWKRLGDNVGYIYVRRIRDDLIENLDLAVGDLKDVRGMIIDVRGNSGGGFDADRSFRNFDANDKAEPTRPRYAGPIAILTDERCISAGEGWASWFVANKRARLFGSTTAGASSRKETYTLTNGLYQAIVPVKAYMGFLDRPIERRGIEPDVPVRISAKDLAAGVDTVLETARRYLLETPAK